MTRLYEAKVLAGVHAGAKATLSGRRTIVGSAADCDIVLMIEDVAPRHGAIIVDGDALRLTPLDGPVILANGEQLAGETELSLYTPFSLGPVILAIGEAGAPWPRIDLSTFGRRPVEAAPADTLADSRNAAAAQNGRGHVGDEAVKATTEPDDRGGNLAAEGKGTSSAAPAWDWRAFRLYPVVGLLAVGILFIGFTWFAGAGSKEDLPPAIQAPPPAPKDIVAERLAAIGFGKDLAVRAISDRMVLVTGYVELSAQKASLKESVRLDDVEVTFRVWSNEELVAGARQRLADIAPKVEARSVGPGIIELAGYLPTSDLRSRVVAAVREDVPGVKDVVDRILTRAEVERMYRDAVAASPLAGKVTLTTDEEGIIARGALSESERAMWRRLTADLAARYGDTIVVRNFFVPREKDLPFMVRSVVAGPYPFVVTKDGRRVAEGGDLGDGYKLVSVGDGEITIQHGDVSFVQRFKE